MGCSKNNAPLPPEQNRCKNNPSKIGLKLLFFFNTGILAQPLATITVATNFQPLTIRARIIDANEYRECRWRGDKGSTLTIFDDKTHCISRSSSLFRLTCVRSNTIVVTLITYLTPVVQSGLYRIECYRPSSFLWQNYVQLRLVVSSKQRNILEQNVCKIKSVVLIELKWFYIVSF